MKNVISVFLVIVLLFTAIVPVSAGELDNVSLDIALEAAQEGTVLLKNSNNALPLGSGERIALFGGGQRYIGIGTGTGWQINGKGSSIANSNPDNVIDPYTAFKTKDSEGKITLYDELSQQYQSDISYTPDDGMYVASSENADTAVIIITRYTSSQKRREVTDWYLNDSEKAMLKTLNEKFNKVIAVLDVSSGMEVSWADDPEIGVDALILSMYGGEMGAVALADIMTGEVNPSGKTADTFAKTLNHYENIVAQNTSHEQDFEEDIFVGYRYFETFAKDEVMYPFGYGLSYTNFTFGTPSYTAENGKITVSVDITNTGDKAGKEVAQVYFSAPQKNIEGTVKLSKAAMELVGFKKTKLLAPNETETISVSFDINEMASYDDMGLTGAKSAYVLEPGNYNVFVGNSVREAATRLAGTYTQSTLKITEQLTQYLSPTNLSKQMIVGFDEGGNIVPDYNNDPNDKNYKISQEMVPVKAIGDGVFKGITFPDVLKGDATYEELVGQMTIEEMASFNHGHDNNSDIPAYARALQAVGGSDAVMEKYKIPTADIANGYATTFPSLTMMACTWNLELVFRWGSQLGREAAAANVDIMGGPGINIHRHPLNPRNHEYYSEDPYLTGEMVTSESLGILPNGMTITIKHFAAYNIENSRTFGHAKVTERALREIYLPAFKKAFTSLSDYPLATMTSYNRINGVYSGERTDLMRGILRDEWGFNGVALSDWGTRYDTDGQENYISAQSLNAGTNVLKSHTDPNIFGPPAEQRIYDAVEAGTLNRATLEQNTIEILKILAQLPCSKDIGKDESVEETEKNVALNKSVMLSYYSTRDTFSNNWISGEANCITDGKTDTSFYSSNRSGITIDLGKEYNITKVEVVYGNKSANSGTYKNIRVHCATEFNPLFVQEYTESEAQSHNLLIDEWRNEDSAARNYGVLPEKREVEGGETVEIQKNAVGRYINLAKYNATSGIDVAEVRVYSKDKDDGNTITDVLPTSRVYASSQYNTSAGFFPLKNISDNNIETDWASNDDSANSRSRLIVDLGEEIPVYMIDFTVWGTSTLRSDFSFYLSNDNEGVEKTLVKSFAEATKGKINRLMPDCTQKYRYIIAETNTPPKNFCISELKVWADSKYKKDNSLINLSDLADAYARSSYSSDVPGLVTDMSPKTVWSSAQGQYNNADGEYIYVDLGTPKMLDSIGIITDVTAGKNPAVTNDEWLRTDFDIVASNEPITAKSTETILVNHSGILAEGAGTSSNLCVFEVPDKYKNREYRYVGIKKKPTALNGNIGQMMIASLNIYGKVSDYESAFSPLTVKYDKSSKTITVSTVARTSKNDSFKLLKAYYNNDDVLYKVGMEDISVENGDITALGYANTLTKTINLTADEASNAAYAKIMLWNNLSDSEPIVECAKVDIDPEETVTLLDEKVIAYMNAELDSTTITDNEYAGWPATTRDNSKQIPYTIKWEESDGASEYRLELATNSNYEDAKVYLVNTPCCDVTNLFIGARYYWRVTSDTNVIKEGTFKTSDMTPRFITTESLTNIRDIGGWKTGTGNRVKQGLVYRGCELDKEATTDVLYTDISENDKKLFVDELGIKTEIDLRGSSVITSSPLGDTVTYYKKGINSYAKGLTDSKEKVKEIFQIFADKNNYPIYFHCQGGADRTGMIAYMYNGLLGVEYENLTRDWELTSFGTTGSRSHKDSTYSPQYYAMRDYVDGFDGDTLQERVENCLLSIGVTADEIASIRSIALEK